MSPAAPRGARVVLAVAVGGAVGAAARYLLGEATPSGNGFPFTIFAINVVGSLLLALLPTLGPVRRSPLLTAGIGSGVLGGFTTLSTYSEQARSLLADGRTGLAVVYLAGTLAACLAAVALANSRSTPAERRLVEAEGGDE